MALNIKNEAAEQLIRELADLTGESLTQAVSEAVRERLERLRAGEAAPGAAEEILDLAASMRARLPAGLLDTPHGDLLYDHRGLPR